MPTVIGMPKGDIPFSSFGGAQLCTNKLWKYFILSAVRCQMFFAISSSCIISPWNTFPACALPPQNLTTTGSKTQNPSILLSKCLFLHFSPLHLHYPADASLQLHISPLPSPDRGHSPNRNAVHPSPFVQIAHTPAHPPPRTPGDDLPPLPACRKYTTTAPGCLYIYIKEGRPR